MPTAPPNQPPVYSVTEISYAVKTAIESGFPQLRVRGEVSGLKVYGNRYYLQLKEQDAVLRAVVWSANSLSFALEEGMEIIAQGKLTTWRGQSNYQLTISSVEASGEGMWLKLLNERKKKLNAEGLFDPARKKPLPKFPKRAVAITSPQGAAIEDVRRQVRLNWPVMRLEVLGVAVQGENAVPEILRALGKVAELSPKPDLVILTRGGGSIEDLMAFNDENVVRMVAKCPFATVSAVGHETDDVLTDLAADKRVATPTAIGSEVLPSEAEQVAILKQFGKTAHTAVQNRLEGEFRRLNQQAQLARGAAVARLTSEAQKLKAYEESLPHPFQRLKGLGERLERATEGIGIAFGNLLVAKQRLVEESHKGLDNAVAALFEQKERLLANQSQLLESLSHRKVLERGYAVVVGDEGKAVTSATVARLQRQLEIGFRDGTVPAVPKK